MVATGGSQANRISRELSGEAVTLRGGPVGAVVIKIIYQHKFLIIIICSRNNPIPHYLKELISNAFIFTAMNFQTCNIIPISVVLNDVGTLPSDRPPSFIALTLQV